MKKIIITAILVSGITLADTTSVDITITDMKEAIYRLIKDVQELKKHKAAQGSKQGISDADIVRLDKQYKELLGKVNTLEKRQGVSKQKISTRTSAGKYDKEIRNYVATHESELNK